MITKKKIDWRAEVVCDVEYEAPDGGTEAEDNLALTTTLDIMFTVGLERLQDTLQSLSKDLGNISVVVSQTSFGLEK